VVPTLSSLTFLAFSVLPWVSSSDQVFAGAVMPHSVSFLGLKKIRLDRWMLTGTA